MGFLVMLLSPEAGEDKVQHNSHGRGAAGKKPARARAKRPASAISEDEEDPELLWLHTATASLFHAVVCRVFGGAEGATHVFHLQLDKSRD